MQATAPGIPRAYSLAKSLPDICLAIDSLLDLDQFSQKLNQPSKLGGLIEEKISSRAQAFLPILEVGIVRENDHSRWLFRFFQFLKCLDAVSTGHPNIEDYDIGLEPLNCLHRAMRTISFSDDFNSRDFGYHFRKARPQYIGIIRDEDAHD